MAWTTANEVIDAWIGDDAPTNSTLITVWIGKAERLVKVKVPGIQARVDAGEEDLLDNVKDVVTSMLQRLFRNPEGVRTRQETTGPFTGSVTLGGDQPGELWLTDDDVSRLVPASAGHGAFTIDTIPVTSPYSVHYVPPGGGW